MWCVSVQMSIMSVGVVCKCSDIYRECWCGVQVVRCLSGVLLWCVSLQMSIMSVGAVCKCSDVYRECSCGM